jgi:hypothetical protein
MLSQIRHHFAHSDFCFGVEVDWVLDSYLQYLSESDEGMKNIANLVKCYNEDAEKYGYDYVDIHYDFEHLYAEESISSLFYESLFISLYSFLERKMLRLCNIASEKLSKDDINVSDLNGKGVWKYNLFIEKVLKIDLKHVASEWNEIINYNTLRNLIVHNSERKVYKKDSKNYSKIIQIKSLKINGFEDHILVRIDNKDLIIDFINVVKNYLGKTSEKLKIFL